MGCIYIPFYFSIKETIFSKSQIIIYCAKIYQLPLFNKFSNRFTLINLNQDQLNILLNIKNNMSSQIAIHNPSQKKQTNQIKCDNKIIHMIKNKLIANNPKLKYHLNKPKILKQFKNSTLFNLTTNSKSNLLKDYSQRFTYDKNTKSFQKQNLNIFVCEYSYHNISNQNVNNSRNKKCLEEKIIKLKKKSLNHLKNNKTIQQQNQKNQQLKAKINQKSINVDSSKYSQKDKSQTKNKKLKKDHFKNPKLDKSTENKNDILSQRGSFKGFLKDKKLKTHMDQFQQNYGKQNQKQTIKSYINSNYLYKNIKSFSPIKIQPQAQNQILKRRPKKVRTFRTQEYNQPKKVQKSVRFLDQQQRTQLIQQQIKIKQIQKSLDNQIQKIFNLIQQLNILGYSSIKVNQWIWSFCQNNKKFLQPILFKTQGYRSTLAQCKIIYKFQQIQQIKKNLRKFKRTINNQQMYLQAQDLSDLQFFLQQILISKQYFQLKRLQTKIQDTSHSIKNNYLQMKDQKVDDILKLISSLSEKKKLSPIQYYQMLNFYDDVKRLQSRFGKIKGLNIANSKKCQNLTDIQLEILRNTK